MNAPHASTTDLEAHLDTQVRGQEATLDDWGHVRMEKRPNMGVDPHLLPLPFTPDQCFSAACRKPLLKR